MTDHVETTRLYDKRTGELFKKTTEIPPDPWPDEDEDAHHGRPGGAAERESRPLDPRINHTVSVARDVYARPHG